MKRVAVAEKAKKLPSEVKIENKKTATSVILSLVLFL